MRIGSMLSDKNCGLRAIRLRAALAVLLACTLSPVAMAQVDPAGAEFGGACAHGPGRGPTCPDEVFGDVAQG